MGLMFIVGYALVIVAFILYFIKKVSFLKKREALLFALIASLTIVGVYYIAVAISQGDPYPALLWILGIILLAIFTGLGKDIYSYLKAGGDVRDYYSTLKGSQDKEEFKFEEKDIRKKLKDSCPLIKKK